MSLRRPIVTAVRRPAEVFISMQTGRTPATPTIQMVDTGDRGRERHIALAILKRSGLSMRAVTACGRTFEDSDDWARGFGPLESATCEACVERYNDVFRGWETRRSPR